MEGKPVLKAYKNNYYQQYYYAKTVKKDTGFGLICVLT